MKRRGAALLAAPFQGRWRIVEMDLWDNEAINLSGTASLLIDGTDGEMQAVLDTYLDGYNHRRPHQGRGMNGRTPAQAFKEGLPKPQPTKGERAPAAKAA